MTRKDGSLRINITAVRRTSLTGNDCLDEYEVRFDDLHPPIDDFAVYTSECSAFCQNSRNDIHSKSLGILGNDDAGRKTLIYRLMRDVRNLTTHERSSGC